MVQPDQRPHRHGAALKEPIHRKRRSQAVWDCREVLGDREFAVLRHPEMHRNALGVQMLVRCQHFWREVVH